MSSPEQNPQNKPTKNVDMRKLYIYTAVIVVVISIISYVFLITSKPRLAKNPELSQASGFKGKVATTIEDEDFTQDIQIEKMQLSIKNLEIKLDKIKLNSELSRILLSFCELRSLIDMDMYYDLKLQEFNALAVKDYNLNQKSQELSKILRNRNYKTEDIATLFRNSIDEIITLKSQDDKNHHFGKVKNIFSKLVIIRRIDGKILDEGDDVDWGVLEIERLINEKSYQKALNEIGKLDEKYQKKLKELTIMLQNQVDLDETSKDIFLHLKTIINNV